MLSPAWVAGVLGVATVASVLLATVAARRDVPMSWGLTVSAVGVTGKLVTELAVLVRGTETTALLAAGTVSGTLLVYGWVVLVAHFAELGSLVRGARGAAVGLPLAAASAAIVLEAAHGALGGDGRLLVDPAAVDPGVTAYSYLLLAATLVVLLARAATDPPVYRRRAATLALAPLPPAVTALAQMGGWLPGGSSVVTVTYVGTLVIAFVAIERQGLFDVAPLARETTVNAIDDAVLAVTVDGHIASLNDAARGMLGLDGAAVGTPLEEALASYPEVVEAVTSGGGRQLTLADRVLRVDVTPIEKGGARLGSVVQLTDVTGEVRRREELHAKQRHLEAKNEQLDQFASVVSHDIRNPLNVAQGNLELLAGVDLPDDAAERVETIATAHERIQTIVDDLLALARQGQTVADPADVDFPTVVEEARATVGLPVDRVTVEGPETVAADRSRLLQLLENLLRNCLDHAGEGVSVRVGPLPDGGFYVADDGPGVPEDERDRVFVYGYHSGAEGTGLGLNIVRTVADAHGWDVDLVASADGGARFEFHTGGLPPGSEEEADVLEPDAAA
ncbi:MAG: ATP-binding protein [Halobacteriaceae archaeon]